MYINTIWKGNKLKCERNKNGYTFSLVPDDIDDERPCLLTQI